MIVMIAVVGYGDLISGTEISFSIFYLVPIGYGAWFINARVGLLAAALSAAIWYAVETQLTPPVSHPLIPVWNATVRMGFFGLGVTLVSFTKRNQARLQSDILQRTRDLSDEIARRDRLKDELLEISSREQVKLAKELHDGLSQYLSALGFQTRMLVDDLRQNQSAQTAQAEQIVETVRITNQTIRRLDRSMRVPEAGEGGLYQSIRSLAADFQQLTKIDCELELTEGPLSLEHFRALMLYRIVQEALNNTSKHAAAGTVRISVQVEDAVLRARVSDNGKGFKVGTDLRAGSGLRIMQLRAELIGAVLKVGPDVNGGCVVECSLPLPLGREFTEES